MRVGSEARRLDAREGGIPQKDPSEPAREPEHALYAAQPVPERRRLAAQRVPLGRAGRGAACVRSRSMSVSSVAFASWQSPPRAPSGAASVGDGRRGALPRHRRQRRVRLERQSLRFALERRRRSRRGVGSPVRQEQVEAREAEQHPGCASARAVAARRLELAQSGRAGDKRRRKRKNILFRDARAVPPAPAASDATSGATSVSATERNGAWQHRRGGGFEPPHDRFRARKRS